MFGESSGSLRVRRIGSGEVVVGVPMCTSSGTEERAAQLDKMLLPQQRMACYNVASHWELSQFLLCTWSKTWWP